MKSGKKEQQARATREKILKAVIELINEGGYAAASSARIAERAGTTWGAAQHHFGSKEDILAAILQISHERFLERMSDPALREGPLMQRVENFIDRMWLHYQDETYMAALEILLAVRGSKDFTPPEWEGPQLNDTLRMMQEVFFDCHLSDAQIRQPLLLIHCFLTGLTVWKKFEKKMFEADNLLERIKLNTFSMLKGM